MSNIAHAQISSYEGTFLNTNVNEGGVATLTLAYLPQDSITGYMNFTEHLGNQVLCGAGNYKGYKQNDSLHFSFISQDTDAGCGFDWGLEVIIAAKLYNNGDSIVGGYIFPTSNGIGHFNLKKKVTTEIHEIADKKQLSISPNLNNGTFTIRLNGKESNNAIVTITDVIGRIIKKLPIHSNEPNEIELNEPSGLYFVTVQSNNFQHTEKIIINR